MSSAYTKNSADALVHSVDATQPAGRFSPTVAPGELNMLCQKTIFRHVLQRGLRQLLAGARRVRTPEQSFRSGQPEINSKTATSDRERCHS